MCVSVQPLALPLASNSDNYFLNLLTLICVDGIHLLLDERKKISGLFYEFYYYLYKLLSPCQYVALRIYAHTPCSLREDKGPEAGTFDRIF